MVGQTGRKVGVEHGLLLDIRPLADQFEEGSAEPVKRVEVAADIAAVA